MISPLTRFKICDLAIRAMSGDENFSLADYKDILRSLSEELGLMLGDCPLTCPVHKILRRLYDMDPPSQVSANLKKEIKMNKLTRSQERYARRAGVSYLTVDRESAQGESFLSRSITGRRRDIENHCGPMPSGLWASMTDDRDYASPIIILLTHGRFMVGALCEVQNTITIDLKKVYNPQWGEGVKESLSLTEEKSLREIVYRSLQKVVEEVERWASVIVDLKIEQMMGEDETVAE